MGQTVGLWREQFRLSPGIEPGIPGQDLSHRLCKGLTELLSSPLDVIIPQVIRLPPVRIPGIIQEKLDGEFHGFDVTHIDNPDLIGSKGMGQVHLLPHPFNLVGVQPFIISWPAHIVEVIIDSVSSGPFRAARFRQFPDVSPVVITEQQGHIIGYPHSFVIILLYLFIKGPKLWCLLRGFPGHTADDGPLVSHDLLQE